MVSLRYSTPDDVLELSETLRLADKAELAALGLTPWASLTQALEKSKPGAVSILSNKRPIAMFGIVPQRDLSGRIWFLGSPEVSRHSVSIMKVARAVIGAALPRYPYLWNIVHLNNTMHIRWIEWAGFTIHGELQVNGHPFLYFTQRSSPCVTARQKSPLLLS